MSESDKLREELATTTNLEAVSQGKCKGIFNRHKWRYLDSDNRICIKCGIVQKFFICFGALSDVDGWMDITLDEALERVNTHRQITKAAIETRERAKQWLKTEGDTK